MRILTVPKVLGAGVVGALLAYTFVFAPKAPGSTPTSATARPGASALVHTVAPQPPAPFPPAGKKFVGIMTSSGPTDWTTLDDFVSAVHQQPSVYEFSEGWALDQFDKSSIDQVAAKGMLPLITWEPWNYADPSPAARNDGDQPTYKLTNIIDGKFDKYIKMWAVGIKSLGFTVAIRFAQEMNSYWYPWGDMTNGNTASEYVQAWRHVHDIFAQEGATNVIWVWSPNIIWNNDTDLAELYPGNSYVNWIGLDGYYGTPGINQYTSFDSLFDKTLEELQTFTNKPVIIAETGGTNTAGYMARWVTQTFQQISQHPNIIGFVWFEAYKTVDWKIADHPAAAVAFAKAFDSNPLFDVQWREGMYGLPTVLNPSPTASDSPSPTVTSAN